MEPWRCLVPVEALSLLVGRNGAIVKRISQESGADVSISGVDDTPPALSDRVVTLRGEVAQKTVACREVARRVHQFQEVGEDEEGIFVLVIPAWAVGSVVGPNGSRVKQLAHASGAEVRVSKGLVEGTQLQPITLVGTLEATIEAAVHVGGLLEGEEEEEGEGEDSGQDGGGGVRRPPSASSRPLQKASLAGTSRPLLRRGGADSQASVVAGGNGGGGAVASSSSSPFPRRSTGGAGPPPPGVPEAAATSNAPPPPRRLRGGTASTGSGVTRLLVPAPVAAWVVGRRGQTIERLRSESGAEVEVAKQGGAARVVEVAGPLNVRLAGIKLLLESIDTFPQGVLRDVALLVPSRVVVALAADGGKWLSEVQELSGVEVVRLGHESGPPPDAAVDERLLVLSGGHREALARAVQLAMHRLEAEEESLGDGRPSAAAVVQILPGVPPTQRLSSSKGSSDRALHCPTRPLDAAAETVVAECARLGGAGRLTANPGAPITEKQAAQSPGVGSPSEVALLKVLLAGPVPNQAQLRLVLPADFLRRVLVAGDHLSAVAARSGSRVELCAEPTSAASQILSITGTMLGNSMAVLYIQDLIVQYEGDEQSEAAG